MRPHPLNSVASTVKVRSPLPLCCCMYERGALPRFCRLLLGVRSPFSYTVQYCSGAYSRLRALESKVPRGRYRQFCGHVDALLVEVLACLKTGRCVMHVRVERGGERKQRRDRNMEPLKFRSEKYFLL